MYSHKNKLFCIMGETGSGKDSIVNSVISMEKHRLKSVLSYTSRPMRKGETNGVEHIFLSEEEFTKLKEKKSHDIVAYTKIAPYEYMALIENLEDSNIYIIDPHGVIYLRNHFMDKFDIVTIYVYSPLPQRKERILKHRKDDRELVQKRLLSEQPEFDEMRARKDYDYIIYNFDGMKDQSIMVLKSIIDFELDIKDGDELPYKIENMNYTKDDLEDAIYSINIIFDYYKDQYFTNSFMDKRTNNLKLLLFGLIHEKMLAL